MSGSASGCTHWVHLAIQVDTNIVLSLDAFLLVTHIEI